MGISISSQVHKQKRAAHGHIPWLFGRGGRERILICLAVNGPMTVREAGRACGIDSHKAWTMVERLRESGMVVKRERAGGRKYVAINKRLPVYDELNALLLKLDRKWRAMRVDQPRYRWAMWADEGAITRERLDCICESDVRSRVLLFVAAAGPVDSKTTYDVLGLDVGTVLYVLDHFERQRIIESATDHGRRIVRLSPKFYAAKELREFLEALIEADPTAEYRALRRCVRARMQAVLDNLASRRHRRRCESRSIRRRP